MNNLADVLIRYIKYLKVPVTISSIESMLEAYSNREGLLVMSDALTNWNIPHEVFAIKPNMLNKIPLPFITSYSNQFVFVEASSTSKELIISNKKQLHISVNEFKKLFSGRILLAEADKQSGEENYKLKRKQEIIEEKKLEVLESNTPHLKPKFLIIGAQKAGTTSFYKYLTYHPDFKKALKKEIHFFDVNYNKGVNWYHKPFPVKTGVDEFTGEASPYYQIHPLTPERVFRYSPQIKIMSLLRNPVERAYSHYWMNVYQNVETLSFEEAIEKEEKRLRFEFKKIVKGENYNSFSYQRYSYLTRGIYSEQIKRWLKFFKKDQLLFIRTEHLKSDRDNTLNKFCEFIDVSMFNPEITIEMNSHEYPDMLVETKAKLLDYFMPYNKKLYEMTGINFNN